MTPTLPELTRTFTRIGFLSFGGPAAQIALMHREIVEERQWVSENDYLSALSFCMLLPGPEAMQLATWIGWRTHGTIGGLISGLLFVLPGAAIVLALSMVYAAFGQVPLVAAVFAGVQAAVIAVVIEAFLRVAKRALKTSAHRIVALFSRFLPLPCPFRSSFWPPRSGAICPRGAARASPIPLPRLGPHPCARSQSGARSGCCPWGYCCCKAAFWRKSPCFFPSSPF